MINKTKKAYPGSLIQQNFGETVDQHGFLLWDINNDTVEEFDIDNDCKRITVNVGILTDYDNLYFELDTTNKNNNFYIKIIWEDLISNINHENEQKLKKYFIDTYNVNKNNFKIDKRVVFNDKISVEGEDVNKVSLTSPERINEIFTEYLIEKGYDNHFVDNIIVLNTEISNRINNTSAVFSNSFSVKKLWGKNLFSYDEFELDLENINGIVQINGVNEVGKTTIYKSICYILYGKTIETSKSMKHGDSRYINNKLDSDECLGGAIIAINNVDYVIIRKTNIKRNKQSEMVGASTTIEYFSMVSDNMVSLEDNKINELLEVLGSFDSFIRLVLTTGDNLNSLLSITHANFIDSLLTDLGLNIFEEKLAQFKEYKKEYWEKNERISLDINKVDITITNLEVSISDDNLVLNTTLNEVEELNVRINKGNEKVDELLSGLHQIDSDITNITELNSDLEDYQIELKKTVEEEITVKEEYNNYPKKFDEEAYTKLIELKDKEKDELNSIKTKINNLEKDLSTKENTLQLKTSEINVANDKISNIEGNKVLININKQIKENESKINVITEKGKNSKEIYNDILSGINSMKENPTCETCGQSLKGESLKKVAEKINAEEEKLAKRKKEMLEFSAEIKKIEKENESLTDDYEENKNELIKKFNEIVKDNTEEILEIKSEISKINKTITLLNTNYQNKILENEGLLGNISKEKTIKSLYEKGKEIKSRISQYPLLIENIERKIKQQKTDIKRYDENKVKIKENEVKQENIQKYKNAIKELISQKEDLTDKINTLKFNIKTNKNKLEELINKKDKFTKQIKKDELFKIYENLVHRDGIPSVILKKSIPLINIELSNLLQGMSFSVWFNDDLDLKMSHNIQPNSVIDAIEGCGKERTFIAVCIKTALNRVNTYNRPDFIMLDEIMGKLIGNSVEQFRDLLHHMKNYYRKIFIIEHNHIVNPDNIIEITKNEFGISSLNII